MEEDFPGGPMVKTPCFHCRWHKFYPWSGSEIPLEAWHGGKKKKSVWMQMGRRERRGEKKGAVTPTSNQELLVAATGSSLMTKALGWIHLLAVCLEDALEPCVL